MAREPISPHLRQWNAWFHLFSIGRTTEAKQQMDRVVEEDPLSQMWRYSMSVTLFASGRDDEALSEIRKAVELDPQFWLGWTFQSLLHAMHGRHPESLQCAEKAIAGAALVALGHRRDGRCSREQRSDRRTPGRCLAACGAIRPSGPSVWCTTSSLAVTSTALSNGRRRRPTSVLPVSSRS